MERFWLNVLSFIGYASAIGFSLHMVWEYLQCSPLFIHLKLGATTRSMILATLGDVIIFWTSYLAVAAFSRSILWSKNSTGNWNWILFALVSAATAEIIEYSSITRQLWSYTSINPTINGVSLVPALQMIIINPITLFTAQKIAFARDLKTTQ